MTYSLTFKLSQDHMETTLSALSSRLGFNDNPTSRQFRAAYKRILVHNEIVASVFGNCFILNYAKNLPDMIKMNLKKIYIYFGLQ